MQGEAGKNMIDPEMQKAIEASGPLEPPDWCVFMDTTPGPGRALVCTICQSGEVIRLPISPQGLVTMCNEFITKHRKCGMEN